MKASDEPVAVVQEGSFAVLVALIVSAFVAAAAYTTVCATQFECTDAAACHELYESSCSFKNAVTPAGYRMFNVSMSPDAIGSLQRGVCVPGMRQNLDQYGRLVCVRAPSYPDAFVHEIVARVPETSDSRRVCGRWMDAKAATDTAHYWAFNDEEAIAEDLIHELQNENSARVAIEDVDRFRAECERMLLNSAAAPAASNAYEHLKTSMREKQLTRSRVLENVGLLSSFYCDAPLTLGLAPGFGDRFAVNASTSLVLSDDVVSSALYAVGESSATRERARAFVREMRSAPMASLATPSNADLSAVLFGSLAGSFLEESLQIHTVVDVHLTNSLESFVRFLHALSELEETDAEAYLLAVASSCAFSTRAAVTGEFGTWMSAPVPTTKQSHIGVALGRIEPPEERLARVTGTQLFAASTVRWSALPARATLPLDVSPHQAKGVCYTAATVAFGDALDEHVLDSLATPRLVEQVLPPMVESIKQYVASALESSVMAPLIPDATQRHSVAQKARAVQVKIAGAPRESFFGRSNQFERPEFKSSDGALLLLLKQARAVYLDRMRLAVESASLCDHPPVYSSVYRNAYLLTAAPCAMLLPGILTPPFASDRYDTVSIYSRIGYVIAHEVAHVASDTSVWDLAKAEELLANYSQSTWIEAAADTTAAAALVASGKVSAPQLCDHVAQLWGARWSRSERGGGSHPAPNHRGDALCAFLRAL